MHPLDWVILLGTLVTQALTVEDGAVFDGQVSMTKRPVPSPTPEPERETDE